MSQNHVMDLPALGSIESSLRQAAGWSTPMVADADFATDQATTLAAIATRNAAIVNGLRPDLYSQYRAVRRAVELGFNLLGNTIMTGGSLSSIYTACEANNSTTWKPGFGVAL